MNNLFETETETTTPAAITTDFHARVIGEPQTQGSTRAFVPKGWKRPVITSDNKKLRPWRNTMSCTFAEILETRGDATPLYSSAASVEVEIILPRLKSMPKTAKAAYRWPTGKSDLDKHLRAVGDALKDAQVIADDGLICAWHAIKRYAEIGESPGIIVAVRPVSRKVEVPA